MTVRRPRGHHGLIYVFDREQVTARPIVAVAWLAEDLAIRYARACAQSGAVADGAGRVPIGWHREHSPARGPGARRDTGSRETRRAECSVEQPHTRHTPYRAAFFVVLAVVVGIAVLLPLAVRSVWDELVEPPEGGVYPLPLAPGVPPAPTYSQLHVSLVDIDEGRLLVTLRVSGNHVCRVPCDYADRIVFFSYGTKESETTGMPPSAKIDLTTGERVVTDTITLPLRGNPSRYPFDAYELWLGVAMARVRPDGTVEPLSPDEARGHLFMTLQEHLPREIMSTPQFADPDSVSTPDDPYQLQVLTVLGFARPLDAQVLAILLVVLIAAAAAYAVFMRPLQDLVIGSGALVLGVWGIRAILSPGTAQRTVVDLALSAVILFLLGAITVRVLQYAHTKGGLPFAPDKAELPGNECDHVDCPNTIVLRCESCRRAFCPRHISGGLTLRCDDCASADAAHQDARAQDGVGVSTPTPPVHT
jgi:hypothetical protein